MNVLIVDDQPEVAESMRSGVNWKNVGVEQVFTAYSVKEAQGVFEQNRIDILLCDIEMPPTNGFVLVRWVQERFSGVVSIFLTAHAEFGYAQEAVKLGSFDYILQPAPYAEIEAAVERAAGKVREAENQRRYNAYVTYRGADDVEQAEEAAHTPVHRAMDYIRRNIDKDL
ncbi:MAG: response regulator, partial [Clostridia bacterium]|nr:response regulator [Clostridia bacterium]